MQCRLDRKASVLTSALLAGLSTAALIGWASPAARAQDKGALRVCSDPDNLPFSNRAGEGFENKLAELMGKALGEKVSYEWARQGPGFLQRTLEAKRCDVVMGIPTQTEGIATTRPYYWSSYVFVARADRKLHIVSLKDKKLKNLKIGVEQVSDDRYATPPARALQEAGLAKNIVSYPVGVGNAGARIVAALMSGDIDVAAVWGPRAGYYADKARARMEIAPIGDTDEFSNRKTNFSLITFQYDISMGVRIDDSARRAALDAAIAREKGQIDALLGRYGVPIVNPTQAIARARSASAD